MCDLSTLAEITLIIHCRQSRELCELRRELLQSYSSPFKDVVFLLKDRFDSSWSQARRCYGAGDPYWCVAEEMRRTDGSGILYMQFDVALSPCQLARQLDPLSVAHFQDLSLRYFPFDTLDRCREGKKSDCWWYHWNKNENKSRVLNCGPGLRQVQLDALGNQTAGRLLLNKLRHGIWWSVGDFFYVPKHAFPIFAAYAPVFREQGIHHELASPTLLEMSASVAGASLQDLHCLGSCCTNLQKAEVLDANFLCGHRLDYRQAWAAKALLSLTAKTGSNSIPRQEGRPVSLRPPSQCGRDVFADVTLVVHCREAKELCQRWCQLLRSYSKYFKEVVFFLKESIDTWTDARHCNGMGDPHRCIAEEMQRTDARGILYMQSDTALDPCELAKTFGRQKVGNFQELFDRYTTFDSLDRCGSHAKFFHPSVRQLCFHEWNEHLRKRLAASARQLDSIIESPMGDVSKALLIRRLQEGVWRSAPYFFYLPREAFDFWRRASTIFEQQKVGRDLATATLLQLSVELEKLEFQSFECFRAKDHPPPAHFACAFSLTYDSQHAKVLEDLGLSQELPSASPQPAVQQIWAGVSSSIAATGLWTWGFGMMPLSLGLFLLRRLLRRQPRP